MDQEGLIMGKITVELTFPGGLKNEPIIYYIGRDFRIVPNIIEASFSTTMGWAILTLEGEKEEIDRLFAYLGKKDITIKTR